MSDLYEFEKYLTDMENIKKTIEKYGVAICPILDNYECEEMINDKWNLLEYLTKDFGDTNNVALWDVLTSMRFVDTEVS